MQESYKAREKAHKRELSARKKDKNWNFAYQPKITGDMYVSF